MVRYARLHGYFALRDRLAPRARAARMTRMQALLALRPGDRVVDLGGTTSIWRWIDVPLDVTILNLPGTQMREGPRGPHRFRFVEGDATCARDLADGSFDLAFSNSCIEHVGGPEKRAAFAAEIRRLAPRWYVQTPSILFPLEPHTGLPFWWFYPPPLKRAFVRGWRRSVPAWCEMIEGTTVILRRELESLFPDGAIAVERVLGVPKSLIAYKA